MKKVFALVAAVAVIVGLNVAPATAQTSKVVVTVIEGVGNVCSAVADGNCAYDLSDPLWSKLTNNPPAQGFYAPGVGPAATRSPTRLAASGNSVPTGLCVSTLGGVGCDVLTTASQAESEAGTFGVFPSAIGVGAYCGSSRGRVHSTFTSSIDLGPSVTAKFIYGWEQSLATVLPLVGKSEDNLTTIIGFASARGLQGSGNCGAQAATTGFQVEGFTVSFEA